jgi:predicted metalloprotease with PDZ domain
MKRIRLLILQGIVVVLFAGVCSAASKVPISLYVDASDGARRLLHSELAIPVDPGPVTLVYPRWGIPTYEAPAATADNIVRLKISGNGQQIEWHRDLVDVFAFHAVVPDGVKALNVSMDIVAPTQRSDFIAATGQLLRIDWYALLLYPREASVDDLQIVARVRLPAGWKSSCPMAPIAAVEGVIEYPRTSLAALVDSPLLAGKFFKTIEIRSASKPVVVDIAADTPDVVDVPAEWRDRFRRLIAEAGTLFGGYPYHSYHFLIALSDKLGNDGLEHRESTNIWLDTRALRDDDYRRSYGYLIPHEYVHAWNGKFAVPSGLIRQNFQQAQTTELVWVYEGLTRYLNWVLAARSGVLTLQESRDYAALLAAKTSHRSGREWRSLQDTAVAAGILNDAPDQWESLRRGADYYDEALFIWLEADTTIRRVTQGRRSLDDFCKSFFGPAMDPPNIRPYTLDDVVSALNRVAPYNWMAFFQARLETTDVDHAPLDGLVASGWSLVYGTVPGTIQSSREKVNQTVEERFSLGLLLQSDGTIVDVVRNSPAWNAGLGPGMKVLALNQRPWTEMSLRYQSGTGTTLTLVVQNGTEKFTTNINDYPGPKYPQLERNGHPDLMGEILRPHGL